MGQIFKDTLIEKYSFYKHIINYTFIYMRTFYINISIRVRLATRIIVLYLLFIYA